MYTEHRPYPQAPPPRRRRQRKPQRAEVVLATVLAAGVVIAAGVMAWGSFKGAPNESSVVNSSTSNTAALPVVAPADKVAVAPPSTWKLTFNSDFSGSTLDTDAWAPCFWWGLNGCTNFGNNGEDKEWYLPSQVKVSGGVLQLVAKHERTAGTTASGKPETYSCRSGMVTTQPSFNFEYGYIQMVARLPYGNGMWPAFWLSASNKKWPPEIDVFEHWGAQANAGIYLHPLDNIRQGGRVAAVGNLSKGWHTFTLSWTKNKLTWYIDDYQVFSTTTSIPRQDMYLVANLADTSTAANSCSGTMLVKSIKVWQPAA
jgi:beta-glucanase (GH16 family)